MSKFHMGVLSRFDGLLPKQVLGVLHKNQRDMRWFFTLISQMLAFQILFMFNVLLMIATDNFNKSAGAYRATNILHLATMTSYILMYIGFSRMVKSAYNELNRESQSL